MAKGALAKTEVIKKIAQAFGEDFVGEYDKKVYVWAKENGEKIQIAISMTCPKVPIDGGNAINFDDSQGLDFENMGTSKPVQTTFTPAEISDEERNSVAELMERLGL